MDFWTQKDNDGVKSHKTPMQVFTNRLLPGEDLRQEIETLVKTEPIRTLSPDGCHIDLSVANQRGEVFAGHLKEGCFVHTTVELALLSLDEIRFARTRDSKTGYDELLIS